MAPHPTILQPSGSRETDPWQAAAAERPGQPVFEDDTWHVAAHVPALVAPWDYLIVTAANPVQARSYQQQLGLRHRAGLLGQIGDLLVIPDPGVRLGSGGSTIGCLMEVLRRELPNRGRTLRDPSAWSEALCRLRILILHAGGDARRLPAYGPFGKLFVPLPGASDALDTLFDRQLPSYLALPQPPLAAGGKAGQIVIAAGDVWVGFAPAGIRLAACGITALGCYASPEQSAGHGVFRSGAEGQVLRFFQKPSPQQQVSEGLVDRLGRSIVDTGVVHLDAATAVRLLEICRVRLGSEGSLAGSGPIWQSLLTRGLDLYREIACALGAEVTAKEFLAAVRHSGSRWDESALRQLFEALRPTPFCVHVLSDGTFLHFGTSRQLLSSGTRLSGTAAQVEINNEFAGGSVAGGSAWVEACRLEQPLELAGENVVTGIDVDRELSLPRGACLSVIPGCTPEGECVSFICCHSIDDTFQEASSEAAQYCGRPLAEWLRAVGAAPEHVWSAELPPEQRSLWNARLMPAETPPAGSARWLWVFDPTLADQADKNAWLTAPRYSLAEIAVLADHEEFHRRRGRLRAAMLRRSLPRLFAPESRFSAEELALVLQWAEDRAAWVAELLSEAHGWFLRSQQAPGTGSLVLARMMHSLGSAVARLAENGIVPLSEYLPDLRGRLPPPVLAWLQQLQLEPSPEVTAAHWADRLRAFAFEAMRQTILASAPPAGHRQGTRVRSDELVWGRAPARLDLGGGWTDTPPYTLEYGGCVLNAAVDLNGQPPLQVFGRVTPRPVIRITSVDRGTRQEITTADELLDFRSLQSEFSLTKAAVVLAALDLETAPQPADDLLKGWQGKNLAQLLERFGGGIELTTLAAIPKGSGLGASSILGAVILAVLARLQGQELETRELIQSVLRLEQLLSTGGGWQDQVGGIVPGVKLIATLPGLLPNPEICFVSAGILDPAGGDGQVLLYYTGVTRLAKNILGKVVGRYLDRQRAALAALEQLRAVARHAAAALGRRDLPAFGHCIAEAWRLNKQLQPDCSTPFVEELLSRLRPHFHGAKLLGAGGGGFLLLVCKSPEDAGRVRRQLESAPPNDRARFFRFNVNRSGLCVSTC